jgi:hypothetical protein
LANDTIEEENDKYSRKCSSDEDIITLTVAVFARGDCIDAGENEGYESGELYFIAAKAKFISNALLLTRYDDRGIYTLILILLSAVFFISIRNVSL